MAAAIVHIVCPNCGRKVGNLNGGFSSSGTRPCPGCKIRVHYDYDKRTGRVITGWA